MIRLYSMNTSPINNEKPVATYNQLHISQKQFTFLIQYLQAAAASPIRDGEVDSKCGEHNRNAYIMSLSWNPAALK